jgi:hypothetical protein
MPITLYGKTSSDPIPMIENLWDFYISKTSKTVFVSIGTSSLYQIIFTKLSLFTFTSQNMYPG